ncbi:MAG: hypothetical protein KAX76_06180 [Comamonas sp.]|nr:hypothetical protein [Comamonas sp.]
MSDSSAFGFGKFIPGFDFLQNLSKAGQPPAAMPSFSHWVAPTMSVEEIDKRIEELKAVQFWLEQNNRALSATVQALQVQKMTLSTLKGMNVNLTDLAKAFPFAAGAAAAVAPADAASNLSGWPLSGAEQPAAEPPAQPSAAPEPEAPKPEAPKPDAAGTGTAPDSAAQAANMATAMQWWGALTQQFQHIAQQAMQDPAQQQAMAKATQMGSEFAKTAVKTAGDMVRKAVAQVQPVKAAASGAAKAAPSKSTPSKAASSKAVPAKKAAVKRSAPAKKAVPSDKKPVSAASKTKGAAAKKSTASKTRAR